ncbi:MAG: hypothetical protein ACOYOF_06675 [Verrucomicrobiaceae bacterium]
MKRITTWFNSLFAGSDPSPPGEPVVEDPLDYDKAIHLDAENLSEQGILSAYEEMLPVLMQFSESPLEVKEEVDHAQGYYAVHAGGKKYEIWVPDSERCEGWVQATIAFFEIVNASLGSSSHKFYALYTDNDLDGIFLTEAECAAARLAIKSRSDWPWMPVDVPPQYGRPI